MREPFVVSLSRALIAGFLFQIARGIPQGKLLCPLYIEPICFCKNGLVFQKIKYLYKSFSWTTAWPGWLYENIFRSNKNARKLNTGVFWACVTIYASLCLFHFHSIKCHWNMDFFLCFYPSIENFAGYKYLKLFSFEKYYSSNQLRTFSRLNKGKSALGKISHSFIRFPVNLFW